eukprot:TRINITY_DN4153_c3_g2_i2.p1 TRINITY_DN4153_c3_g2~~TRINITY_DN4153_c3_g2_i2.p1  ORF type:complete len:545 (+),score=157.81 TRINITY_DN4153_c3_g2_i2:121-1755(+)
MGCVASTAVMGATRQVRVQMKYAPGDQKKACEVCGGKGLFCIGTGERHTLDADELEKLEQDRVYLMGIYDSASLLQSLVYYLRHGTSLTTSDGVEHVLKLRHKDHKSIVANVTQSYPNLATCAPQDLVLVVIPVDQWNAADDAAGEDAAAAEDVSTEPIPFTRVAKIVLGCQEGSDCEKKLRRLGLSSSNCDAPLEVTAAQAAKVLDISKQLHGPPPACKPDGVPSPKSAASVKSTKAKMSVASCCSTDVPYLFHQGPTDVDAKSTVHTFTIYLHPPPPKPKEAADSAADADAVTDFVPPTPPDVPLPSSHSKPPLHPLHKNSHCPLEGARQKPPKLEKLAFCTRMIHDLEAWVIALSSLTNISPSWRRALDISTYTRVHELDDVERCALAAHNITPQLYLGVKDYMEEKKVLVKQAASPAEARKIAYGIGTPTFRASDAALKVTKGELRFWTGCDIFRTSVIWTLLERKKIIFDNSKKANVPMTLYSLWFWSQAAHDQGSWLLRRTIRTVMLAQRCPRDKAARRLMLPDDLLATVFAFLPLFP